MSSELRNLSDLIGIKLHVAPTEAHIEIGAKNHYHAPLRRAYMTIRSAYPTINQRLALRRATKSMKDSIGSEHLVSSLRNFGALPSLLLYRNHYLANGTI